MPQERSHYIQVEPSFRGKKPVPELPPFFEDGDGFAPLSSNMPNFPEIPSSAYSDEYTTHTSPFPGFEDIIKERIFRVSADSEHAHIPSKPIDWPSLLNTEAPTNTSAFVFHRTMYSDRAGDLHRSEAPVTKQYNGDLHNSDQVHSPYVNFTRAMQVFKPASGKVDNVVVVNDGIPYLITGILDRFEKLVVEKKLSPNTAFVFIDALPGLKKTLSREASLVFNKEPSANLPVMGVRLIDYKHGIDQYIDFIDNRLLPQLKKERGVPDDPNHRVMIGSSLSGTASIYIGSKRPDLFGAVVAQSPSPDNREILSKLPRSMLTGENIHLSCGKFEHPNYAAANSIIEYAIELSSKLDIPLHVGAHGHQFMAWNEELDEALPALALQKISESGHVPAVSYAYVEPQEETEKFSGTSIAIGKKSTDAKMTVRRDTQFPASSLSKIVFTYLVLQLVKDERIDLDKPLHDILPNERFLVDGEYPQKAKELTARHVLSHTTGLPNWAPSLSSPLTFDHEAELGEKYSYSGEAFLYLQNAIESKTGKDLEALAKEYVFEPLGMERSTFLPPSEIDANVVSVHTELGKPTPIYVGVPYQNAAGSLLTTGEDFSKFMTAWLENMDDPTIKQAFEPANSGDSAVCGLGWHIHKNQDEAIAYQYGENPNTRAFVAINLTQRKGAAFFTNSENGMSIANQIFNSSDLPPIGDLQGVFRDLHYSQSDEPGWQDTISGKVAEVEGKFEEARRYFERAHESAPEDESKQLRLKWFNAVHQPIPEKQESAQPLKSFVGKYKNPHEEVEISLKYDNLICNQSGHETKLMQISETDFLPEKDQSFKISIDKGQMSLHSIHGYEKSFAKEPGPKSQGEYKDEIRQLRESQPGYMRPTESSKAKERDKSVDSTPKPSWRP